MNCWQESKKTCTLHDTSYLGVKYILKTTEDIEEVMVKCEIKRSVKRYLKDAVFDWIENKSSNFLFRKLISVVQNQFAKSLVYFRISRMKYVKIH